MTTARQRRSSGEFCKAAGSAFTSELSSQKDPLEDYSDVTSEQEGDESEAAAADPERLAEFHIDRMLSNDGRNGYKLVAIIDYHEEKSQFITHVLKR